MIKFSKLRDLKTRTKLVLGFGLLVVILLMNTHYIT
jgi:hypothetical protein